MEERRSSVANGQERKKEIFFFCFSFFLKLTFRGTFVSVLLTWRKQQLVCGGSLARDLTHTHNSGGKIPR